MLFSDFKALGEVAWGEFGGLPIPGGQERNAAPTTVLLMPDFCVQFSRLVVSDTSDLMDYSTPGVPVLHHLPEFAQTHLH